MAMSKTVLAAAIVAKLKLRHPEITGAAEVALKTEWEDVAGEIITHFLANAVITINNVGGITVSAVTAGMAASGPATGTATGVISA